MGPGRVHVVFQPTSAGGHAKNAASKRRAGVKINIGSTDLKATVKELASRGVKVGPPVTAAGAVTYRDFKDNNGYSLSVVFVDMPVENPTSPDTDAELHYSSDQGSSVSYTSSFLDATWEFFDKLGCKQVAMVTDVMLVVEVPGGMTVRVFPAPERGVEASGWMLALGSLNLTKSRAAAIEETLSGVSWSTQRRHHAARMHAHDVHNRANPPPCFLCGSLTVSPPTLRRCAMFSPPHDTHWQPSEFTVEGGGRMRAWHIPDDDGIPIALVAQARPDQLGV